MAMIRIEQRLPDARMQAKMLLQVHDELVFEAPPEESNDLKKMVKSEMERVYPLAVPLLVDIGIGDNWRDAK
jgi:DNA polymerase-1